MIATSTQAGEGGEALSLAAAVAVVDKVRSEPVIETIWQTARGMFEDARAHITAVGLDGVMALEGLAPSCGVRFRDRPVAGTDAIEARVKSGMADAGVLVDRRHHVCFAHHGADRLAVGMAYERTRGAIASNLETGASHST